MVLNDRHAISTESLFATLSEHETFAHESRTVS